MKVPETFRLLQDLHLQPPLEFNMDKDWEQRIVPSLCYTFEISSDGVRGKTDTP